MSQINSQCLKHQSSLCASDKGTTAAEEPKLSTSVSGHSTTKTCTHKIPKAYVHQEGLDKSSHDWKMIICSNDSRQVDHLLGGNTISLGTYNF